MRARLAVARLPRDLHPVAWWLWAVGLAVAASFTAMIVPSSFRVNNINGLF